MQIDNYTKEALLQRMNEAVEIGFAFTSPIEFCHLVFTQVAKANERTLQELTDEKNAVSNQLRWAVIEYLRIKGISNIYISESINKLPGKVSRMRSSFHDLPIAKQNELLMHVKETHERINYLQLIQEYSGFLNC